MPMIFSGKCLRNAKYMNSWRVVRLENRKVENEEKEINGPDRFVFLLQMRRQSSQALSTQPLKGGFHRLGRKAHCSAYMF